MVKKLVGRAIMIKEVLQVYGEHQYDKPVSQEKADVAKAVEGQYDYLVPKLDKEVFEKYLLENQGVKFKFSIEGVGRKIPSKE